MLTHSTTPPTTKRRTSRLLRYSLRSLFVTSAVIGVLLAMYVVPAERQRQAVAQIRAAGGEVTYLPTKSKWRLEHLGQDYATSPWRVLFNGNASESSVYAASRLPTLITLHCTDSHFTDAHLGLFATHTEIRELWLSGTAVTDDGLRHLATLPHLQSLDIAHNSITDEGLNALVLCSSLEEIRLAATSVTEVGVSRFRAQHPQCKVYWSGE